MGKGNTNVIGLNFQWRKGNTCDALRSFVFSNSEYIAISAKIHPTLKQINEHLKLHGLRKSQALADNHFQILFQRLQQELRSEYGLKTYKAIENLNLKTKQFDFEQSVEEFFQYKNDVSCSNSYRVCIKSFWLPFFISKGCEHPKDFKKWQRQAVLHIKSAKNKNDEYYSHNTYGSLAKALNEYIKFLKEHDYISEDNIFHIKVKITLEQIKRGKLTNKRSPDTYTENELLAIKAAIDNTYQNNLKMKLRAYALYFGVCTGLRRGNLLGLRVKHLFPEANVPHFQLADNILNGWSRGIKGTIVLENSSKMSSFEEGSVRIPLIQPDKALIADVALLLKNNLSSESRLIEAQPDVVSKWWKQISKECGFKFLSPLQWRHSYATLGALHLADWYKNNTYLLQQCCLHSSIKMTEKYVNQKSSQLLKAFE
jgi:integrase